MGSAPVPPCPRPHVPHEWACKQLQAAVVRPAGAQHTPVRSASTLHPCSLRASGRPGSAPALETGLWLIGEQLTSSVTPWRPGTASSCTARTFRERLLDVWAVYLV